MGQIQIQEWKRFDRYIRKDWPTTLPPGLSSIPARMEPSALRILFRASAVRDIGNAIDWGRRTTRNRTEQGGILVGNFCDAAPEGSDSREVWVEVLHAIPCEHPETSTPEFLVMSAENWLEMENIRSRNNLRDGTNDVLVGWYHTHPGMLPTGFSGTDFETHSSQFPFAYSIGAVFNPHRQIWSVYYGPSCQVGAGYLCFEADEPSAPPPSSNANDTAGEAGPESFEPSRQAPPATQPSTAPQQPFQQESNSPGALEPQLTCQWYQLVLENSFLWGLSQITVQPDYSWRSAAINQPICETCGALIRLLRLNTGTKTIVATAEILMDPSGSSGAFRLYSCAFCYDRLDISEYRPRNERLGVLLVGNPAGIQQDLKELYHLLRKYYGWVAVCDTTELERFRCGQINIYRI